MLITTFNLLIVTFTMLLQAIKNNDYTILTKV
jgi:hypothetical protein